MIDIFAWIEYLIGRRRGGSIKECIEGGRVAFPTITILELAEWFPRETEAGRRTMGEMNQASEFVRTKPLVVDLDESMAREAGEMDFLMKKKVHNWPIADSIVYTAAKVASAKVVTGDPHFRSVENAIIV